jgi:hypothetical protein
MTDKTIREQLDASVKQLLELSDAELELELGRRLIETQREIKSQAKPSQADNSAIDW